MSVRRRNRLAAVSATAYIALIAVFMLAPVLVVAAISVNRVGYSIFPPLGFSLRWYGEVLSDPQWRASLGTSLVVAAFSTVIATTAGTLAAVGLHRGSFRGKDLLLSVFMSPLILPGLITGLAILFFFSLVSGVGTTWALVLGHVVITYPYVLRLVFVALARDTAIYEQAAMTLGADEVTVFRRITLPLIKSGVVGGAIFAFIISFDNITISLFLSNPRTITLPIRVLEHIQWSGSPSVAAISTVLIAITAILAVVIEKTIGLQKIFGGGADEFR